ncbi:MAG: VWA domain-containing protein [Candidatus Omnitrophica bacterium]|nr:VWA domain-containing protein [Candidatus Omnitrophota bacterium]
MRFARLELLWFFIGIVAALIAFFAWAFDARKRTEARFAQENLLHELLSYVDARKQRIKATLLIIGVGLGFFALLRPQWGFHWQEVKRKGLDIFIALDTSTSMRAQDIKPSRLQRAKLAVRDLVRQLKGDRIGLIAFAGTAFVQCPLTVDYSGFLSSLESVDTDTIPRAGTSLSSAIREALRSCEGASAQYKVVVIITDGEDHEGNPLEAAEEAKKKGVVIYCIGVGTSEGELILLEEKGTAKEYLKDKNGNVVKSRLDERILQNIALTTGGSYLHATPLEFGLDLLYREKISKREKYEFESKMAKRYEEQFQIPLALACLFILTEALISERRAP